MEECFIKMYLKQNILKKKSHKSWIKRMLLQLPHLAFYDK